MNFRALALGAAIGFLAAVVPACGKSGGGGTGGGSGTGGSGVGGGSGTGGSTGGGGGSTGNCNATTCANGCCAGSTCIPRNTQTRTNCGNGGQACMMCPTGQLCSAGACSSSPVLTKIGDTCSTDADCSQLGGTFKCKKMTTSGNGTYQGGYCTKICTANTDCGNPLADGGSQANAGVCVGLSPAYGESDRFCWDRCGGAEGTCRTPGYACYNVAGTSACWLDPVPDVDAGPPADKIGQACTTDTQCQNPPEPRYGGCLLEFFLFNDGGMSNVPTGYTGGYCTAVCNVDAKICGNNGVCLGDYIDTDVNGCAKKCNGPGAGQADCGRNGYVCFPYGFQGADGGFVPADAGYCDPSCFAPGRECATDAGFFCDAGYCVK